MKARSSTLPDGHPLKDCPLDQEVSIESVADLCGVTSRHLRRIFDEARTPRAHGKVVLLVGIRAFLRHLDQTSARKIAASWTDDAELQEVIVSALIAHWHGRGPDIAKLANG